MTPTNPKGDGRPVLDRVALDVAAIDAAKPWGACDVCDRAIDGIANARSVNGGTLCVRCAGRRGA